MHIYTACTMCRVRYSERTINMIIDQIQVYYTGVSLPGVLVYDLLSRVHLFSWCDFVDFLDSCCMSPVSANYYCVFLYVGLDWVSGRHAPHTIHTYRRTGTCYIYMIPRKQVHMRYVRQILTKHPRCCSVCMPYLPNVRSVLPARLCLPV